MKYLIVASKLDFAGMNITNQLTQFGQFDFYFVNDEVIYDKNIDKEKINKFDFIIFASKHQSEKKEKTLSVHSPGNWRDAEYGGERGRVCPSSAILQKQLFKKLSFNADFFHLKNYQLTLEATHHGPLIEKPCVFIEIGSTENEWRDRKAGFIIAKTIADTIAEFKENPYNEIAVGIGGPHYCPNFNKLQLGSNVAFSHIIPEYALPLTEEMIQEAISKTTEEVDFVVLDWKGIGRVDSREEIIRILDKLYIRYKRASDIER
jgi:D-aminoacyl-tRNA deacylase